MLGGRDELARGMRVPASGLTEFNMTAILPRHAFSMRSQNGEEVDGEEAEVADLGECLLNLWLARAPDSVSDSTSHPPFLYRMLPDFFPTPAQLLLSPFLLGVNKQQICHVYVCGKIYKGYYARVVLETPSANQRPGPERVEESASPFSPQEDFAQAIEPEAVSVPFRITFYFLGAMYPPPGHFILADNGYPCHLPAHLPGGRGFMTPEDDILLDEGENGLEAASGSAPFFLFLCNLMSSRMKSNSSFVSLLFLLSFICPGSVSSSRYSPSATPIPGVPSGMEEIRTGQYLIHEDKPGLPLTPCSVPGKPTQRKTAAAYPTFLSFAVPCPVRKQYLISVLSWLAIHYAKRQMKRQQRGEHEHYARCQGCPLSRGVIRVTRGSNSAARKPAIRPSVVQKRLNTQICRKKGEFLCKDLQSKTSDKLEVRRRSWAKQPPVATNRQNDPQCRLITFPAFAELWSRLEPPLCARSSLCSVSTQCWRSSPCTDDSLQLSPSFGVFRVGVRFRSPSGSFYQRGTLPLGHELGPGSGGILACTLEGVGIPGLVLDLLRAQGVAGFRDTRELGTYSEHVCTPTIIPDVQRTELWELIREKACTKEQRLENEWELAIVLKWETELCSALVGDWLDFPGDITLNLDESIPIGWLSVVPGTLQTELEPLDMALNENDVELPCVTPPLQPSTSSMEKKKKVALMDFYDFQKDAQTAAALNPFHCKNAFHLCSINHTLVINSVHVPGHGFPVRTQLFLSVKMSHAYNSCQKHLRGALSISGEKKSSHSFGSKSTVKWMIMLSAENPIFALWTLPIGYQDDFRSSPFITDRLHILGLVPQEPCIRLTAALSCRDQEKINKIQTTLILLDLTDNYQTLLQRLESLALYKTELITVQAPARSLRSSTSQSLALPRPPNSSLGSRASALVAPLLWIK
ncbi:hypothetical protein DNTS_033804 [Danionella cerebrum]|uniref:Uncharacterized protein n=1 Tax=Danionella cerebrum TaxID=2873325 RepID=A0A553ML70_9TELE|nr:hypothetical protein DNTS_033804 [Danionella translucida]